MTIVREPELTDELLSAYIDNAVTPAERQFVDRAVAADPAVAWQLESLQMTVRLLHELPALALPRSFLLTPEQIGEQTAGPIAAEPASGAQPISKPAMAPAPRIVRPPVQPGFWAQLGSRWRDFWQGGSPALRNAMATSLVLLFVLVAGPRLMTAPLGGVTDVPAAAPARAPVTGIGAAPLATAHEVTPAGAEPSSALSAAADGEAIVAQGGPSSPTAQFKAGADETQSTIEEAAAPLAPPVVAEAAMVEETAPSGTQMFTEATATPATLARAEPASVELAFAEPAAVAREAMAHPAAPAAPQDALGVMGAGAAPVEASPQDVDPLVEARQLMPPDSMPGAAAYAAPAAAAMDGTGMADAPPAALPLPAPAVASLAATSAPPAATPTTTPILTPATAPTAAPAGSVTVARVADNQRVLAAPTMPGTLAAPAVQPAAQMPWLGFAQIVAGAGFVLFGLLWWRSRRT